MASAAVTVRLAGRERSAFRLCGLIGLIAACAVALAASAHLHLSLAVEAAVIAAAVVTFLVLALATKAVTGREALIYYHHEIAVLTVAGLVTAALGAPVLSHLDATALGLGAFLAAGRVGCSLVGCCHGRPARRGIVYGARHVDAGFPAYLAGIRLVPVQLAEAAIALGLVAAGAASLDGPAGSAFGLYVSGYAAARFGLELLRGDPQRPYWHGLSEAQWTSLGVGCALAAGAAAGLLAHEPAHVAVAAVLGLAAAVTIARSALPPRGLLDPRHVRELSHRLPAPRPGRPAVVTTSLGVRISAGRVAGTAHYTFSRAPEPLSPPEAQSLARMILWLRPWTAPAQPVSGEAGTFHLVERG